MTCVTCVCVYMCQVLNLFLALLLSSFGAESLKHSQEDEGPNKLQEAVDRINRFFIYVKSHISYCIKVQYQPPALCSGVMCYIFMVSVVIYCCG